MDYYDGGSFDSVLAGFAGLFGVIIIIIIAIAVVGCIAMWKLFKKAGKKGWESIVPFYSYWILVEIAGLNWWWFLLIIATNIVEIIDLDGLSSVASLVSLFANFVCYYNIAKKFNKTTGTAVCAGIFNYIFVLIFGFSKNEIYNANIPVSKNGIFGPVEQSNMNQSMHDNVSPQNMNNNVYINNEISTPNVESNNSSVNLNTGVKFCGNCGTKLTMDTKFCPNCGSESK